MGRMEEVDDGLAHGKRSTYTKHKCRCDLCKEANAEYKRNKTAHYRSLQASETREDLSPDAQALLGELTHGVLSTYEWYQCRCRLCKAAKARQMSSDYAARLLSA